MRKVNLAQLPEMKFENVKEPTRPFYQDTIVEIDGEGHLSDDSILEILENACAPIEIRQCEGGNDLEYEFDLERYKVDIKVRFKGNETREFICKEIRSLAEHCEADVDVEELLSKLGKFNDVVFDMPNTNVAAVWDERQYCDSVTQDSTCLIVGFDSNGRPGSPDFVNVGGMSEEGYLEAYSDELVDAGTTNGLVLSYDNPAGGDMYMSAQNDEAENALEKIKEKLLQADWTFDDKYIGELGIGEIVLEPGYPYLSFLFDYFGYEVIDEQPLLGQKEGVVYFKIPFSEIAKLPDYVESK